MFFILSGILLHSLVHLWCHEVRKEINQSGLVFVSCRPLRCVMAAFVATWKDMSRRPQQVIGAEHGMSFRGSFPFCFLHFPKTLDSFPIFKWTLILWSTIILLYAGCDLPLRLRTYPFRFYPGCRGAMTARESGDSPCLRRHESSMNHPVQLVVLVCCKSLWRTRMHENAVMSTPD